MSADEENKDKKKQKFFSYENQQKSEPFYNSWEPKMNNRFIAYFDLIPTSFISAVKRPIVNVVDGKYTYDNLVLELYDPIIPAASNIISDYITNNKILFEKIEIRMLGPIGDIVETQIYKDIKIEKIEYSKLDWSDSKPSTINIYCSFKSVEVISFSLEDDKKWREKNAAIFATKEKK